MKTAFAMVCLAAAWQAGSAAAQPATFDFAGARIEVPLPSGHCLPRGPDVAMAQRLAAVGMTSGTEVTHLTLFPCAPQPDHRFNYVLVKTPTPLISRRVSRSQLMRLLGPAFDSRMVMSDEMSREVSRHTSRAFGAQVTASGNLRARGHDDVCGYMGGDARYQGEEFDYVISMGACVTTVADRVIAIYWYAPPRGEAGVIDLMRRARRLAISMSGRAAG